MSKKVTAILTCFNRKDKTVNCLETLVTHNRNIDFNFLIVDDNSSDGTVEAVQALGYNTHIIKGNGNLYWCGGMRKGIEYYLSTNPNEQDYCLLVNDDVDFFENSIENLFLRLSKYNNAVVIGATCDSSGNFTYGLKRKEKWYKRNITRRVEPSDVIEFGDTMNANCVLIRNSILKNVGNLDSVYTHSLGDYDLGFAITRKGYKLISSSEYVGICEGNSIKGTWRDKSLSLKQRFNLKESPKGSPFKEWWHFLDKNFGIFVAVKYSLLSYMRLFLNL